MSDTSCLNSELLNGLKNTLNNFRAGKTKLAIDNWANLTSDPWILENIKGVIPVFLAWPYQSYIPKPIQFDETELEIVQEQVKIGLAKGIMKERSRFAGVDEPLFISNVFTRPKADGSNRLILNLKQFNEKFVEHIHFKLEGLKEALYLLRKDYYCCSLDFKDAFYSISLHESITGYFSFMLGEKIYEMQALPMGYRDSCRILTKLTKPALTHLRENNVNIIQYMDDALLVHESAQMCYEATKKAAYLFDSLGFTIHPTKSILSPTKTILHMGFLLNTANMTVSIPEKKANKIKEKCVHILAKEKCSIQTLSEVIGTLVAASPGNRFATLYFKRLEICRNYGLARSQGSYESMVVLDTNCKEDLQWWTQNVDKYPVVMEHSAPVLTVITDACKTGYGGLSIDAEGNEEATNGLWDISEQEYHINVLELEAAYRCIQIFTEKLGYVSIEVKSDNSTTVSCITKQGSTKMQLNEITRKIWLWCKDKHIWITCNHLPGLQNISDGESRKKGLQTEWELNERVFLEINAVLGPFDIDLFASRINAKVNKFVSWKKDINAWHVDAFTLSWRDYYAYIFPPFNLISRILQKLETDQGEAVIIVPLWKGQPFYPVLLDMLVDVPFILPNRQLLLHPVCPDQTHPILEHSKMIACKISGVRSRRQAFRKRLVGCSSPHGGRGPGSNMRCTFGNGPYFVLNGKLIHFKFLRKTR